MATRTLSIDGLAATSTRSRDEVVLFDRTKHDDKPTRQHNNLDSLQPAKRTAQVETKLRTTQAKQRGWEVVAKARQDAKHRPRHNQRHAAKKAAHHHRQRHDMDNYARAHTATLELDETMNSIKHTQPKVSLRLHVSSLLQSHAMKFAGFGMTVLAIVGGVVLFTGSAATQTATQPVGEVQAVTTTTNNLSRSAAVQTVETVDESAESTQVTNTDSDGNLNLWSSSLD